MRNWGRHQSMSMCVTYQGGRITIERGHVVRWVISPTLPSLYVHVLSRPTDQKI